MSAPGGYIPFLVAPQRQGLDLSIDPWLTPQDAFQEILDGYQYLGVVYKRDGYSWFDAVPHVIPKFSDPASTPYQNISDISLTVPAIVTLKDNHGMTGTHNVRLNDVEGITPSSINGIRFVGTFSGGGLAANQFSINNDFSITGPYTPNTGTASYFPGLPVMCIANWVDTSNVINIMVLDTRRASIYDSSIGCLVPIGSVDQFTGSDSDFFWWENYRGVIYFTNNLDNIFTYGTGSIDAGLDPFTPIYSGTSVVDTCLMIKAISSRLCLFNTKENGVRQPTRVRWCKDGVDPLTTGAQNPWDQVKPGFGYFADLLDSSYIISLAKSQTNAFIMSEGEQFSTFYEMRPVSDPKYSFAFTNIGVSRNVNSTFGTIILDTIVTAVGNSGLVMTDGNNINRYDEKIPNFVLQDIDQENIDKCFGIRNDTQWQTWILYPSSEDDTGRNSRVLVYNYMDQAWSIYRISMSCLGLIDFPSADPRWQDYTQDNLGDWTWNDFGDQTWASGFQRKVPMLVGGDYEGNVWRMNNGGADASGNQVYLQTVDQGNPIEFQLTTRQWFPFAKEGIASQFGFVDFLIDGDADTDVQVDFQVDNQGNNYLTQVFTCFPFENVLKAEIQNILLQNPCVLVVPDHPFSTGDFVYIYGVQGTIELNDNGYTVTVINSNTISINVDATSFTPYVSQGFISDKTLNASPFWLRVMCGQTGVFHQLTLTTSGIDESFGLHGIMNWFKGSGRIYR